MMSRRSLVVYVEGEGEFVRGFVAVLLGFEMEEAGVVAGVRLLEKLGEAGIDAVAVGEGAEAVVVFDATVFAHMRRKMMRSMIRWTAKLSSRWESLWFRRARLRARSERQVSMVLRNSSSTSAVPLALMEAANLSKEPLRTASREKMPAIRPAPGVVGVGNVEDRPTAALCW